MHCPITKIEITAKRLLVALLVLGITLSASGFILEHFFGAEPCQMCWWQRYAHWAIAALALLGIISKQYRLFASTTAFASLSGLGIAIWQTGGQLKWWKLPEVCQGKNETIQDALQDFATAFATLPPRCDEVNFTILHFSLAEWNIPAMLLTLGLSLLLFKTK